MTVQGLGRCQKCGARLFNHSSSKNSCLMCGHSSNAPARAPKGHERAATAPDRPLRIRRDSDHAIGRGFVISDDAGDQYQIVGAHHKWVLKCLSCQEFLPVCTSVKQAYNHARKHYNRLHR